MARSMSREVDICEWRNAMEELRGSIPRHDNMEVFQTMKLSYDYLNDLALQQCFLYCALFPKDCWIKRQHLIERFIDEGLINGLKSREAEFDKGHTMLNRLEKVCLLESDTDIHRNRAVKMHHMIRNMALQILQANSQVLVEAGEQLKEIPEAAKWTKNLFIVSLMRNNIKEIPSSYSPWCPNLSTLLLSKNHALKSIADSFFRQLHGLRILDLSYTDIQKLPDSISDLVSLNVLLLKCCEKLSYLPSLTKLVALNKLDLGWTSIVQVPQGLELLSNLKYLDLSRTSLIEFPAGILLNLSRLQLLSCPVWDVKLNRPSENSRVKGEEVACLKNLETLKCWFYSIDDYITYIQSLDVDSSKSEEGCFENDFWLSTLDQDTEWQRLSKYYLQVGADALEDDDTDFNFGRAVVFCEESIGRIGEPLLLPKNIQTLELFYCSTGRSLVLENATKLKSITVSDCYELECLLSLCSSHAIFQSLQSLKLYQLDNLCFLFGKEEVIGLPPIELLPPANTFFNLKKFLISYCPSIQKLFHSSFVPNLQNLEKLVITNCSQMREIIAVEEPEQGRAMGEESNRSCRNPSLATSSEFHLQNLKFLELVNLPALKSICSEVMNCDSIQDIHVVDCPMLKNMPVSLPLPSLKRIGVDPKEWWESVEWDNPTRKNALLPFCVFRRCWWEPLTAS